MVEVAFSSSFQRAFKKRIRGDATVEDRFWNRVAVFQDNPFDPKLKTHKLSGQLQELWSFSVAYDIRVIFNFVSETQALFVDIGTHHDVY